MRGDDLSQEILITTFSNQVVVSGKLRGQRAKSMKFVDGLMIHSGDPVNDYVDSACRHVLLRQGVLGIKVMINIVMLATFSKAPPRAALPCRSSVEAD